MSAVELSTVELEGGDGENDELAESVDGTYTLDEALQLIGISWFFLAILFVGSIAW